jgi:hypothetical protein
VGENEHLMAALNELACQCELWWRVAAERQQGLKDAHDAIVTRT